MNKFLATLLLAALALPAAAHELVRDGNVGALLHIEPDDDPAVGQPNPTWFEVNQRGGRPITLQSCACVLQVYQGAVKPGAKPLGTPKLTAERNQIGAQLLFEQEGAYTLVLTGKPRAGAAFLPFRLEWVVRAGAGEGERQHSAEHQHPVDQAAPQVSTVPAAGSGTALKAADLQVSGAYINESLPGVTDASAYFTLTNRGKTALKLTGAVTNVAAHAALMHYVTEQGGAPGLNVRGMRSAPFLTVPAGGQLVLQPAGNHLMLMDLKKPLRVGETVTMKLQFGGAAPLTLKLPVRKF